MAQHAQIRVRQFKKYPGTVDKIMPDGDYLTVERVGRDQTSNDDLWQIWDLACQEAQTLSAINSALQPELTKDLVQSALKACDRVFAEVNARIVTHSTRVFSSVYGGPIPFDYLDYSIRWPGESRWAMGFVMPFVSALFQIPQVPSNRLDHGILDNHANIILRPLFDLKADIMRKHFGMEIQGEVSPDELDAMFRESNLSPPLNTTLDDERDSGATLAAEDARAMGDESAVTPTKAAAELARIGHSPWTFVPEQRHWDTFNELLRRRESAGPSDAPGVPFPFSISSIGAGTGTAGGSTGGTGTTLP